MYRKTLGSWFRECPSSTDFLGNTSGSKPLSFRLLMQVLYSTHKLQLAIALLLCTFARTFCKSLSEFIVQDGQHLGQDCQQNLWLSQSNHRLSVGEMMGFKNIFVACSRSCCEGAPWVRYGFPQTLRHMGRTLTRIKPV